VMVKAFANRFNLGEGESQAVSIELDKVPKSVYAFGHGGPDPMSLLWPRSKPAAL